METLLAFTRAGEASFSLEFITRSKKGHQPADGFQYVFARTCKKPRGENQDGGRAGWAFCHAGERRAHNKYTQDQHL